MSFESLRRSASVALGTIAVGGVITSITSGRTDAVETAVFYGLIFGLPAFLLWPRKKRERLRSEAIVGATTTQDFGPNHGLPKAAKVVSHRDTDDPGGYVPMAWVVNGVAILVIVVGLGVIVYVLGSGSSEAAVSSEGAFQPSVTTATTLATKSSTPPISTAVGEAALAPSSDYLADSCGPPPQYEIEGGLRLPPSKEASDRYNDCMTLKKLRDLGLSSAEIVWCDDNYLPILKAGESLGLWQVSAEKYEWLSLQEEYGSDWLIEWIRRNRPDLVDATYREMQVAVVLAVGIGPSEASRYYEFDNGPYVEACKVAFELR